MTAKQALEQTFGFSSFKKNQEKIILDILNNKDALIVLPTGSGKSLCYQLPASIKKGLTLVISPLIALMKDQVDKLQAKGIASAYISSDMEYQYKKQIFEQLKNNELKLLYISPERLAQQKFIDFLKTLPITLLAIDEAHCISEWGHEFRPDYRNIAKIKSDLNNVQTVAVTATATKQVISDMKTNLGLKNPCVHIGDFDRPNLNYIIKPKKDSFNQLIKILNNHSDQSSIIYCFSRQGTEKLAASLRAKGLNAQSYHAGLNQSLRNSIQEKFINNHIQIVVATVAFGMGIDKHDVRLVIHYDLPKSIEAYYQETGRAGRDGKQSNCVLFFSQQDIYKHHHFIDKIEDNKEKQKAYEKLKDLIDYCRLNQNQRGYLKEYFLKKEYFI